MKFKQLLHSSLILSVVLFSCQKQLELEDEPSTGGNTNTLNGNYDLVNIRLQATSTFLYSESGVDYKAVVVTDYTSKNNQGTVLIDGGKFNTNNVSYTVDTTIKGYFYVAGVLVESVDSSFTAQVPPFSDSTPYTESGTDSLTFQNATIGAPNGSGITIPNVTLGAKLSWSGNILTLKSPFSFNENQVINGTSVNITYAGTQWITLQKK
ncbi:hypothetical protein [Flavihumibacter fluvii]|uniref:hypothetical protein n=1 Tax=Flavihumibacter fluvii TaxID=2838157 RepID=UPI001BDECB33|nr:hypothetical protein [Flavihumibacter fluvii]ULQ53431.1 hypothetical protein KJS93_03745 [Flavihumibacter fluvii]